MKNNNRYPITNLNLISRLRKQAETINQIENHNLLLQSRSRDDITNLLEEAATNLETITALTSKKLPNRIFLTGVPGSKWSGISQLLEDNVSGFNISNRSPEKEYLHNSFSGHKGTYFGKGMEFEAYLSAEYIDQAWKNVEGCKMIKSHEWAYHLDFIKKLFPNDWIMLVYRPDMPSYAWWHEAGGFNITYPNYASYKDSSGMLSAIMEQNKCILKFAKKHNAKWHHFGEEFVKEYFGNNLFKINNQYDDCLVTIIF